VNKDQVVIRAVQSSHDVSTIMQVDTSYSSDRIYRLRQRSLSFRLVDEPVQPSIRKRYPIPSLIPSDRLLLAHLNGAVIGFGELALEEWNRRVRIEHLYVSPSYRGRGAGRALLNALEDRARDEPDTRCLWLESQNTNYPAI
jgi:ribosomal protein S18 acetylase RimI-like enzyme